MASLRAVQALVTAVESALVLQLSAVIGSHPPLSGSSRAGTWSIGVSLAAGCSCCSTGCCWCCETAGR